MSNRSLYFKDVDTIEFMVSIKSDTDSSYESYSPSTIPSGLTISVRESFAFVNTDVFPPVVAVTVSSIFDIERMVMAISIHTAPPSTFVCTDKDWVNASFGCIVSKAFPSFIIFAVAEMLIVAVTSLPETLSLITGFPGVKMAFIPAREYTPSPYISSSIS